MKKLKGVLALYGATGEVSRPQFIANKGLKNRRVIDYDYVYDIQVGDQIGIDNKNFFNQMILIHENYFTFLFYLVAMGNKDFKATYIPAPTTKSWGQITEEYKKGLK